MPELLRWTVDFDSKRLKGTLRIVNAGSTAALTPNVEVHTGVENLVQSITALLPGASHELQIDLPVRALDVKTRNIVLFFAANYAISEGHYVGDEAELAVNWERGRKNFIAWVDYKGKVYFHNKGVRFRTRDEKWWQV
jgi:hypothetical protein